MVKNKFSLKKTFLAIILLTAYCIPLTATVRYVSHEGSNTPPYLTWETAADSIMSAINISVFGDTIYVANGVYEEQIVMIPGLSLIGAGMDSTVILLQMTGIAVQVVDSSIFKGFKIIVPNTVNTWGIEAIGYGSLITLNKVVNASLGLYLSDSNTKVYKNIFENIKTRGIWIFNSNSVIRKNLIYIPASSNSDAGIRIEAFDFSYKPIIDSNYIVVSGFSYTAADGIYKSFGASPIITHNTIILKGPQNWGIFLGDADSGKVFNNLIVAEPGRVGIINFAIQYLQLYNNYATGNFVNQQLSDYVIMIGQENVVKNNIVTGGERGVGVWASENPIFQYNNVWDNDVNYSGFTPDSTNLSVDPMIVNDDSTQEKLDFHLQMFSPLIDAGDPNLFDIDGSRSDIGLYGGPFGGRYKYLDLAPKPPRNLTAVIDSQYITLSWNKNTEADFKSYNLFRDTTANFTADSTTFVASLTDTFYIQVLPDGIDAFYYKLTATDNQGNESQPSEELAVIITSVNEYPATVSNYQLYQNYPNTFNPSTKIGYKLEERGYVKLYVYDIKGELVDVLVNHVQEAGYYEVEFGRGLIHQAQSTAKQLASGIYIYQIMIKSDRNIPVFTDIKKMIFLK